MAICKKCGSAKCVKSGKIRTKQRRLCKECGCNFVEGDARTNGNIAATKAMCVVLYTLAKSSYNMLGRIFNRDRSLVCRWIREAGASMPEPDASGEVKEIGFDEMWHFIKQKKTRFGSSKPMIAAHGELSPGCSALVMLQHSGGFTTK